MDHQNENSENIHLNISNDIEEQKIISLSKFILLSFITFGLYSIWWFYKSWRFFQQKENSDILPAVRAIFSIVFLYQLLSKILSFAKQKGYSGSYSSTLIFISFFFTNLLSRLPDPYWLISSLSFVFIIPPFKALNFAKQNSSDFIVSFQTSFNKNQIVLIVLGSIIWTLGIIGMMMPEDL
jgi:hypothetical protein